MASGSGERRGWGTGGELCELGMLAPLCQGFGGSRLRGKKHILRQLRAVGSVGRVWQRNWALNQGQGSGLRGVGPLGAVPA